MAKRRSSKKNAKGATAAPSNADATLNTEQAKPVMDSINCEALAAALSSASRVMMKVCRLCENKDGPFLNIFGAENMTAKKIDDIMPFVVAENDNLPHKICFRCSAKVEELYEFIQKCTKTQESLRKALGNNEPITPKVKTRTLWEEKLNESNMSNDDICNALIRKAMEGIKDIPVMPLNDEEKDEPKNNLIKEKERNTKEQEVKCKEKEGKSKVKENMTKEPEIKKPTTRYKVTQNPEKEEEQPSLKSVQLQLEKIEKVSKPSKVLEKKTKNIDLLDKKENSFEKSENKPVKTNNFSIDLNTSDNIEDKPKPFDIMDHVSTIKVNGVGILFQCKLCNRNFLKKEVVMHHGCAKNGGRKVAEEVKTIAPEPPKIPLIKYINTKPQNELINKTHVLNDTPINIDDDDDEDDKPLVLEKPKRKIGPASKVKRSENKSPVPQTSSMTPEETANTVANANAMPQQPVIPGTLVFPAPTFQVPFAMPQMNSRYKLVPGPNNSFMLVEDKSDSDVMATANTVPHLVPLNYAPAAVPNINQQPMIINSTPAKKTVSKTTPAKPLKSPAEQPYPVGLIKKVSHQPTFPTLPESFTTPAMKKQSYTVVQTGNPSKLLISTKPQPVEEVPKKKPRKSPPAEINQNPYSISTDVDDRPKNAGFFTFVNVDPMSQPSYVLPTDSIIQESQISTSTTAKPVESKEQTYSCNMCGDKFSREKKLLAHIQSHYKKMDEEDLLRAQKNPKKRKSKV